MVEVFDESCLIFSIFYCGNDIAITNYSFSYFLSFTCGPVCLMKINTEKPYMKICLILIFCGYIFHYFRLPFTFLDLLDVTISRELTRLSCLFMSAVQYT